MDEPVFANERAHPTALPETGTLGAVSFAGIGIVFVIAGCAIMLGRSNRRQRDEYRSKHAR